MIDRRLSEDLEPPAVNVPCSRGHGLCIRDVFAAILILVLVSLLQGWLAFHWFSLHVFDQFNVLFDTDPNTWLRYGSSTRPDAGTSKHPLAAYYTGMPVLGLSKLVALVPEAGDPPTIRTVLALCAAPLTAGLKNALIYLALRGFGLMERDALLVTGIAAASFSSVVFGSVPETYGYTGLFAALMYFLLSRSLDGEGLPARLGFFITAFLSIGASTANLIGVFWMFWVREMAVFGRPAVSVIRPAILAVLVCLVTLSTFWALTAARGVVLAPSQVFLLDGGDITHHSPELPLQATNFARFPERLARTIIATTPVKKENRLPFEGDIYPFELSYNPIAFGAGSALLYGIGLLMILVPLLGLRRLTPPWRAAAALSGGLIASYAVLFSYYGHNTFLYSQHWQVPAIFLLATVLSVPGHWAVALRLSLTGLLLGVLVSLALTLREIDATLLAACGARCL